LTALWVTFSSAAARVAPPVRAMASKARRAFSAGRAPLGAPEIVRFSNIQRSIGRFRQAGKSADRARHVAPRRFSPDHSRPGPGDDRLLRLQLLPARGVGRASGGGR